MRRIEHGVKFILVLAVIAVTAGCMGGISLFSSDQEHTHYHGTAEIEARLTALEQRVGITKPKTESTINLKEDDGN